MPVRSESKVDKIKYGRESCKSLEGCGVVHGGGFQFGSFDRHGMNSSGRQGSEVENVGST